jgi:NAD(P)-dependent dehydrogenase (short-subunit alcohol dehydrogenase family)
MPARWSPPAGSRCARFLRQGQDNIINTTSLLARQSGEPGSAVYTASKGFAQSLTGFLAAECARHDICVNAVARGPIMTPLQDRNTTPNQLEVMAQAIPIGRTGQPEDCVGAYLFLQAMRCPASSPARPSMSTAAHTWVEHSPSIGSAGKVGEACAEAERDQVN